LNAGVGQVVGDGTVIVGEGKRGAVVALGIARTMGGIAIACVTLAFVKGRNVLIAQDALIAKRTTNKHIVKHQVR